MILTTLSDINSALLPYVPLVKSLTGSNTTLDRIVPLMKMLGNPQDKLKVIHLAGTSGKTSTAYYLTSLLKETNKKIGLTISPHIDSVLERVQINNELLDEKEFATYLSEFLNIIENSNIKPSYFELLYAFSIWVFNKKEVDYAVVETGVGGLYDATNVVTRPDKICVLTDIGIDHTHILGENLNEIAAQKVGIVHSNNEVFTYIQDKEVMDVYEEYINNNHAKLNIENEDYNQVLNDNSYKDIPNFQKRNWFLAYNVTQYIINRDKLIPLTSQAINKSIHIVVPGRMDIKKVNGKTIIMDGAHNKQKMTSFIQSFKELYPNIKPLILLAIKEDKDIKDLLSLISEFADQIILTSFNTTQDLPIKSEDPESLKQYLNQEIDVKVVKDHDEAFSAALKESNEYIVITGSFYLISQLRHNI